MALKASKLKQIEQRVKDLAFGYLRENEAKNKSNYPQLIRYLVLIYSNQKDEFDPDATHQCIEINGNSIIDKRSCFHGRKLSYLKNVVSEGVHIWKLRFDDFDSMSKFIQIGIWKTNSGDPILSDIHIDNAINDGKTCTGYEILMNGRQTNPNCVGEWSDERWSGCDLFNASDIIEMMLDLNQCCLVYKINGKIVAQFKQIEKTSYRAAISTYDKGNALTLTSYQEIYK